MKFLFKIQNSYEQRQKHSFQLIEKHRQMIPLIVQLEMDSTMAQKKGVQNKLQRTQKMMIKEELQIKDLFYTLKQQYSSYISSTDGLFLFLGGDKLLSNSFSNTIADIYQKYQDNDGWLYLEARIQDQSG